MSVSVQRYPDKDALVAAAGDRLAEQIVSLIADRGRATIVLTGGGTGIGMLERLASHADRIDWSKVHLFWGDERCVPPDDPESNYRMAHEALLSKVPIPGDNVYRMRGEEPDHNLAAKEYGEMLKEKFADGGVDLCLLGMGDDGHTASLFPHTPATRETKHRAFAQFVEKWDTTLRPGDECLVVTWSDELVACAQLHLAPSELGFFKKGLAAHVRDGAGPL